jgi:hypothetical protein
VCEEREREDFPKPYHATSFALEPTGLAGFFFSLESPSDQCIGRARMDKKDLDERTCHLDRVLFRRHDPWMDRMICMA